MCRGGRLVADFRTGAETRPDVPEELEEHLTVTTDGRWVVWAYKLARQQGELFVPLTGGPGYPADARAECRRIARRGHQAPDPQCSCGFHALSDPDLPGLPVPGRFTALTVALSGRVLAFDWDGEGVWPGAGTGTGTLWRAERQTVVRVEGPGQSGWPERAARLDRLDRLDRRRPERRRPDDPEGRLAAVAGAAPRGSGPVRLRLPASAPVLPVSHDDAGWCVAAGGSGLVERPPADLVLA
jgi:hypothetical protein